MVAQQLAEKARVGYALDKLDTEPAIEPAVIPLSSLGGGFVQTGKHIPVVP